MVTFALTSTTLGSGANSFTQSSPSNVEPSQIGDLYDQWDIIRQDFGNTIGNNGSGTFGTLTQVPSAYDPLCTTEGTSDNCPQGSDPFVEDPGFIIAPDPPEGKPKAANIGLAVGIAVGVVVLLAAIAVAMWYTHKHKIACFKEPEKNSKGVSGNKSRSNTWTGTEMSTATNLSHTDHSGTGLPDDGSQTRKGSAVYTGGMEKDQSKQKTIDLEPCPQEGEVLPENWARWKHTQTDEILYINSETLFSQRHAPGTESDKKGKWF